MAPALVSVSAAAAGLAATMQAAMPRLSSMRKVIGMRIRVKGGARAKTGATRRLSRIAEKDQPMSPPSAISAELRDHGERGAGELGDLVDHPWAHRHQHEHRGEQLGHV